MLMHMFDTSDYDRSLRRRRLLSFGLLIHDSDALSDYARGFYLGAAAGITAGASYLLIRMQYLLTHPAARKKARIQEQDEREKAIVNQAFQFAGIFTFFAAVASMFVLAAVSRTAALAVFGVIVVYAVTWLIASLYLSKKM